MLKERAVSTEAQYITEWPKVPQLSFIVAAPINADEPKSRANQKIQGRKGTSQETDSTNSSKPAALELAGSLKAVNLNNTDQPQAANSTKTQISDGPWSRIRRLALKKTLWPNPHLSIGTKCSRMGDNECWQAIGPAQALFAQISRPIGELLDTRVDEIEEGEPVAGNILTYGMYMIGRDLITARPTLIVTCQRSKPRRRAINFIKESGILKDHPRISLVQSSVVPLAVGKNYIMPLAATTSSPAKF